MANFYTFWEVATYLQQSSRNVTTTNKKALSEVGNYLKIKIKDMHWNRQPWWKVSSSNPDSPLLKSWELRAAVSFKRIADNRIALYSKKEWLAIIHEYWVTFRMTEKQRKFLFANKILDEDVVKGRPRNSWGSGMITIPARPIWNVVLRKERLPIQKIVDGFLSEIFK